jgi:3',5'-cyclic AMP phosphodiesterase CpdA
VTSIRCNVRQVSATLEEVPTKGLERSLFRRRQINDPTAPLRWNIVAGDLTNFSDHTWKMGYGGWSLFFAPEVVIGFVSIASDWPTELDAMERYKQALRFLEDRNAYKPSERVFPE